MKVKVETANKEERGRKSAYKGKTLIAKLKRTSAGKAVLGKFLADNYRQLPIVYEAYIAAGGRRQDLAHDIKEDRVEVKES